MLNRFSAAAFGCALTLGLTGCTADQLLGTNTIAVGAGPVSSGTGAAAKLVRGVQEVCNVIPSSSTAKAVLSGFTQSSGTTAEIVELGIQAVCAGVAPLSSGPGLEGVRQGYARTPKGFVQILIAR